MWRRWCGFCAGRAAASSTGRRSTPMAGHSCRDAGGPTGVNRRAFSANSAAANKPGSTNEVPMYTDLALHIGGAWRNGDGRQGEDVVNPATEKALGRLRHGTGRDLGEGLGAAKKVLEVWRATSAYDRAKVLRKAANLV